MKNQLIPFLAERKVPRLAAGGEGHDLRRPPLLHSPGSDEGLDAKLPALPARREQRRVHAPGHEGALGQVHVEVPAIASHTARLRLAGADGLTRRGSDLVCFRGILPQEDETGRIARPFDRRRCCRRHPHQGSGQKEGEEQKICHERVPRRHPITRKYRIIRHS